MYGITLDWLQLDWKWIWIGVAFVSVISATIGLRRMLARSGNSTDPYFGLGEVSESWLTQQRADKSEH